jgi:hypothetical protein
MLSSYYGDHRVTSCEIRSGRSSIAAGSPPVFFGFPLLIIISPLLVTRYHDPMKCMVALSRQHFITSLAFKLGADQWLGPEIGTSSIDWAQLSRCYLKTEIEPSLRNIVLCNINRAVFLDKDRTMDNVQKHKNCTDNWLFINEEGKYIATFYEDLRRS